MWCNNAGWRIAENFWRAYGMKPKHGATQDENQYWLTWAIYDWENKKLAEIVRKVLINSNEFWICSNK